MSTRISIIHALLAGILLSGTPFPDNAQAASSKTSDWGIHRIWGPRALDELPEVKGGFVIVAWADVNPEPGVYDFGKFDSQLSRYDELGKRAQVAIRGGDKPDYLFEEVPYHPDALGRGVNDPEGSLQYWHPRYRERYRQLLVEFAEYLRSSPYRPVVYSVRQNLNAFGTENTGIDEQDRDRSQWIVPEGVEFVPYSDAQNDDYEAFVAEIYFDLFVPDFLVFSRSVLLTQDPPSVPPRVLTAIQEGRIGVLHTSSVPEPTKASTERKYSVHLRYGRDGATPVYAEPFSSSTKGSRGDQPGPQWNYWRILSDLHAGVSYIAVYGSDIEKHANPEYLSAFRFGNRYAGYQISSHKRFSPGAWVALREGDEYLLGDYTFLMSRMPGDANTALSGVGPAQERFGAWARRLPSGGRMRFKLDEEFAAAVGTRQMTLRVTFLNANNAQFAIQVGNNGVKSVAGGSTGNWKTVQFAVSAAGLAGNQGADITLTSQTDVTLHMVELVRSDLLLADQAPSKPGVPPAFAGGTAAW